MKKIYSLGLFSTFIFLSGCASFWAAGEVQQGRLQLMFGDPKVALAHFQRAAESDPNFVMSSGVFHEGVWTYVGRANYVLGKFPDARQALERARSQEEDTLAKLYLGLVLARDGDQQRGLKEIEGGMRGIYDWLEYVTYNTYYGHFWDPNREIRSEIQKNLDSTSGRDFDFKTLIASGEWVGEKMEDEIDKARRDRVRDQGRQSEGRNGKRR